MDHGHYIFDDRCSRQIDNLFKKKKAVISAVSRNGVKDDVGNILDIEQLVDTLQHRMNNALDPDHQRFRIRKIMCGEQYDLILSLAE